MHALILAAGMATRLRPLTDKCPKCLLEVNGRAILGHILDALIENGCDEVTIVVGYYELAVRHYVSTHYPRLYAFFINNQFYDTTNNIYSLYLSRHRLSGKAFTLLDSDILFDPEVINRLNNDPAPNTLALNRHKLGEEEIKVVVDADQKVSEISKTCSISDAIGESIGIEKISASYSTALFNEVKKMVEEEELDNIFYERAFERLIPQGFRFAVTDVTDLFSMELDTIEDYEEVKNRMR